jgi:hypothetical protein
MSLVLVSGPVCNLKITRGTENLLDDQAQRVAGGVADVVGSLTGSTGIAGSNGGGDIDMDFFTCTIGNKKLHGKFYRVDFNNGDVIDFVAEVWRERYDVQAARDAEKQIIWTLPHQMRGHLAQKRHDIVSSFKISFVMGLLVAGASIFMDADSAIDWKSVFMIAPITFTICLIVNFLSRWSFYRFSLVATDIFWEFGFDQPEHLDLPKQHGSAEREYYAITGESYSSGQPWKYRYGIAVKAKILSERCFG